MEQLEKYFNELKKEYGNELPCILEDIREAVEHGLTNSLLIDEILNYTKPTTKEAEGILSKLETQGIRTPYALEVSNIFYYLRKINEILTQINRYIN